MNKTTPGRGNVIVLKQLLNLIPRGMINRLAIQTGVQGKARTFSVTSHLAAMIFAQLARTVGLNDVCDWLRLKAGLLSRFGVTPPSRNALSHANKVRSANFIEQLFWSALGNLQRYPVGFCQWTAWQGSVETLQGEDPRGGLHGHGTGGQLHGLGSAVPTWRSTWRPTRSSRHDRSLPASTWTRCFAAYRTTRVSNPDPPSNRRLRSRTADGGFPPQGASSLISTGLPPAHDLRSCVGEGARPFLIKK